MKDRICFFDGTSEDLPVFIYGGACLVGQPTAFVYRAGGNFVWVVKLRDGLWSEAV